MSAARLTPPVEGLYVVRLATAEDLETISAIERVSFSQPWSVRSFRQALENKSTRLLVAVPSTPQPPSVCGYAVTAFAGFEADLLNLAVHPEVRGAGVGRLLLDRVVEEVRERGGTALFLEVRVSNSAARRLYSRAGFTEVGVRKRYYSHPVEDALTLRLQIR